MEHVNDCFFCDIYKGGLWEDEVYVCAQSIGVYCHDDRTEPIQQFLVFRIVHPNSCDCKWMMENAKHG